MTAESYDYIICGGGTAGCVIAARLAEDADVNILLVEAGDHSDNVPQTKIPVGTFSLFNTEHDWAFFDDSSPALGGRNVNLARGKVLGGSSAINATYAIRGTKTDYDQWDLPGWSGDEVFAYMRKAETFAGKDTNRIEADYHGTSGPIKTEVQRWLPIDERVRDSYFSKGFQWRKDLFSTGAFPEGCSDVLVTAAGGIRSTAAAYLTGQNVRSNVEILTKTVVDKVEVTRHGGHLVADSVHIVLPDGSKRTVKARREIILSAGAYCSPTILLRSGIGPKEEISKHGIDLVLDVPAVGKNLQDHNLININYEVSEPGLTTDHLIWHEGAMLKSLAEWEESKTGFYSSFPYAAPLWARLDRRLKDSGLWNKFDPVSGRDPMGLDPARQPNVEIVVSECWIQGANLDITMPPMDGSSVLTMFVVLFGAQSRGTVTIPSIDPFAKPIINHNYLGNELDSLVLAEGCRLVNEIVVEGDGTKDIIKGAWPRGRDFHQWDTREQWAEFVRKYSTGTYHPAATCSMGKEDNPNAVVDEQLRVRGIQGLRVADVSVIPTLNSGHPQMLAYAIGEKAADLLKAVQKE